MYDLYVKNKFRIDKWLLILGFILFLYLFVAYLFSYVAPFVIGYVVSLILEPLVSFIQNKLKLHRGLVTFFCIAIASAIIIFAGTRMVIIIVNEAISLLGALPELIEDVRVSVTNFVESFQHMIELVPEEFQQTVSAALDGMVNSVVGWATSLLGSGVKNSSSSLVKNFPGFIMSIIFCLVSSFFFTKDKKRIRDFLMDKCHPAVFNNYLIIKKGIQRALGGYFRAQIIIMTIAAIISIIGLTILNYQFALLIGLAIMIFDGLPVFGSGTILLPLVVYNFIKGDIKTGIGLMIVYGIITLMRQTLEPKILGEQIGIYPLVTLMSIYVGLRVFGVLGFILGPIIVVTVTVLNEAWESKDKELSEPVSPVLDEG